MYRKVSAPLVALIAFGMAACSSGRYSASGFRLPADGNIDRGRAAFVVFGCNHCHVVPGLDLPHPAAQSAVLVTLGGTVSQPVSDAFLVTSIINPSARRQSRMPHYADRMTVRQVTDLVEFLQAAYTVAPAPGPYPMN